MNPEDTFQNLESSDCLSEKEFDLIYNKYAASIYGMILSAAKGDEFLAEKLTHQTFISIFHEFSTFNKNKCKFFTWIYLIAKRKLEAAGIAPITYGNGTNTILLVLIQIATLSVICVK